MYLGRLTCLFSSWYEFLDSGTKIWSQDIINFNIGWGSFKLDCTYALCSRVSHESIPVINNGDPTTYVCSLREYEYV